MSETALPFGSLYADAGLCCLPGVRAEEDPLTGTLDLLREVSLNVDASNL